MKKRIFLIVLDSFGVGELPDAADFGDEGSNTLRALQNTGKLNCPNLQSLGLFNIENCAYREFSSVPSPLASFGRMREASRGKDTTTGHWEIAGLVSKQPLPTFPHGFPQEIIDEFDFDSRTSFRRKYLTPMLKNGVLKMTIPEKPSSKNQKYFS